jgi:predicted RNA methylase
MFDSATHSASPAKAQHTPSRLSLTSTLARRMRGINTIKRVVLTARRWRTLAIERCLNIHTPYPHPEHYRLDTQFGDAVPNEPVDYLLLWKFMKPLRLGTHEVVFDIGCGMGRVLCAFARRNISQCVGIEFDPQLAEIAVENGRTLRGRRAAIEVRCGDAAEADYSAGTIYWLFNPFGSETLQRVMKRIERSVIEKPRAVRIVYVNPVHEDVLRQFRWLERTGFVQSPFFGTYGASYWRSATSVLSGREPG